MDEDGYKKRFCFAISHEAGKEKFAESTFTDMETTNGIAALLEGNLLVHSNDHHYFFMLEVASILNLSDVRSILKKYKAHNREAWAILNWLSSDDAIPMKRIFKKQPLNNHLIKKIEDYKRTVMTLKIKNDPKLRREYMTIHRPEKMWPQILENMETIGIMDMELYLTDYQAFLIMDTDTDFDMEKDGAQWAALPREQEWQQYVARFQKTDPKNKATEKWKPMRILKATK